MERWVELTHVTGAVQGCGIATMGQGSWALISSQRPMSKSSVATFFSSTMVRWSELGSLETKLL